MALSERCSAVQARLTDALFARVDAASSDLQHTEHCGDCGTFARDLSALGTALSADGTRDASDGLVGVTLVRARAELSHRDAALAAPLEGFGREVSRLVGLSLLPLPIVLLWNAAVLSLGDQLLTGIVPDALLRALTAGYVLAGTTWLACLYGSLPVVAHRVLRRRSLSAPEVAT
ncbi:MAG: hypothetical protein JRH10_09975 [Deltaproteobacteria bacterium]|nr:hypothetical protein [Deltaproteobacteria bacterium]MBW2445900.1 hypothetical protein [Deltaproteobacteria bacterium]